MSLFQKKKYYYNISIIGAGNVGSILAPALESAGHAIKEVYSRNIKNAQWLCDQLYEAEAKQDFDFSESEAQIFIIAVPDDFIHVVAENLLLPEAAILLHISGSVSMDVLKNTDINGWGVMYPLQTFSKSKSVNFHEIPLLIEGNDADSLKIIRNISNSISKHVKEMTSEQRAVLHIAAVFSCNFTNHMISIAEDLSQSHQIDFDLLKPLIVETINKSMEVGAKAAQTGPARRSDLATLERQYKFLNKTDKSLAMIYKNISESILKESK